MQEIKTGKERILNLTLKKQWFDLILKGEKKEEYREIKPFWATRLVKSNWRYLFDLSPHEYSPLDKVCVKEYDIVRFTHGYGNHRPSFDIECKGISIGTGNPDWGGSGKTFIISLGEITEKRNII